MAPDQELRKDQKMTRDAINQRISWGVARSWKNQEVKQKRLTRHTVRCNGKHYGSVLEAFNVLGLNVGKHIKFRMLLKQQQTATYVQDGETYNFELSYSF